MSDVQVSMWGRELPGEAQIKVTYEWRETPEGGYDAIPSFEWVGRADSPVRLDPREVERRHLPWDLQLLSTEIDYRTLQQFYVRRDVTFWRRIPFIVGFRLARWAEKVNAKLILTAMLWTESPRDFGAIPRWCDVRWFKSRKVKA